MKKLLFLAIPAVLAACAETPTQPDRQPTLAVSTAPGQNKIQCFASGDATCTLNSNGAKGSATLTVTGAGAAAVYYVGFNESIYGVLLSGVSDLSFQYTGDAATAGAPRFSVPRLERIEKGSPLCQMKIEETFQPDRNLLIAALELERR